MWRVRELIRTDRDRNYDQAREGGTGPSKHDKSFVPKFGSIGGLQPVFSSPGGFDREIKVPDFALVGPSLSKEWWNGREQLITQNPEHAHL